MNVCVFVWYVLIYVFLVYIVFGRVRYLRVFLVFL